MGGSGSSTAQPYTMPGTDAQLQQFIKTQAGQQYASMYQPNQSYAQVGNSIQVGSPGDYMGSVNGNTQVGPDVSAMMTAFGNWMSSNAQTQTNWQNYANAASANEGGEGDQTITSGAAQGQREALLGALANPNAATSPTVGLGSMALLRKNGVVLPPGSGR